MRREKSLLPIHGVPLVQRIYRQLEPHFHEVIISAEDTAKHAFLGARVIPDEAPGQGPTMGILTSLEASTDDLNFVVACDIPDINIDAVRRLIHDAQGYDAVVPTTTGGRIETLFAVYRKATIPVFRAFLEAGDRKILLAFDRFNVRYADFGDAPWLKNLNTPEEYDAFLTHKPNHK